MNDEGMQTLATQVPYSREEAERAKRRLRGAAMLRAIGGKGTIRGHLLRGAGCMLAGLPGTRPQYVPPPDYARPDWVRYEGQLVHGAGFVLRPIEPPR